MSSPVQAPAAKDENRSSVIARLEPIAKAMGVLIAMSYAVGLMVANRFLMSIGLSDFSTLRPRHILTGLWSLLLITLALLPVIVPLAYPYVADTPKAQMRRGPIILLVAMGVIASVFFLPLTIAVLRLRPINLTGLIQFQYVVPWLEINLLAGVVVFLKRVRFAPSASWLTILGIGLYLALLPVSMIGRLIYGYVPQALGGGKPMTAHLIFNKEGVTFWKQTGAKPLQGPDSISSQSLQIVFQDDHEMAVIAPCMDGNNRVIVLSKSLIDGFMQDDDRLLPPS